MPNQPKNHHYVPQWLLKNFCFEGEAVWYYYKDGGKRVPIRRNIERIFSAPHFYTIEEGGKKSAHIETGFFQKIDDVFAGMIQDSNEAFDEGTILVFEGERLQYLYHIFSIFAKRTKDFLGNLEKIQLEQITEQIEVSGSRELAEHFSQKTADEKRRMVKNSRIRAQASESTQVLSGLDGHLAVWATAPKNKQFVLGSYPVIRFDDGVNNVLGSVEVELWMPVAPNRMLGLVHPEKVRSGYGIELSAEKVREINEYIFSKSTEIASANFDLLASLLRQKS